MGIEIERKFLVTGEGWRSSGAPGTPIRQGYLSVDPARTVRVRLAGEQAWITLKGPTTGSSRPEFEYAIPAAEAHAMLDQLALQPLVEKVRYRVLHDGDTWEVDVFEGHNEGLVVAELELAREDQPFRLPDWVGEEVTEDHRYSNASLVNRPYGTWEESR